MEQKINIAKLLKDCPQGMELYSPMFGKIYLEGVKDTGHAILIEVSTSCNSIHQFYPDGKYNTYYSDSECLLFPSKDQRDWSKFHRPFEDGEVILKCNYIAIVSHIEPNGRIWYHCWYNTKYKYCKIKNDFGIGRINDSDEIRLATEEEKQKLFKAIKDNGYRWNAKTKTLEKLINRNKFTVGAIITNGKIKGKICSRDIDSYKLEDGTYVFFNEVHNWELVPNKFDINTLKTFGKVLVRHNKDNKWCGSFFSHVDEDLHSHCYKFVTTSGKSYPYCIPYEANQGLLGTTNDCDEYYKTWE